MRSLTLRKHPRPTVHMATAHRARQTRLLRSVLRQLPAPLRAVPMVSGPTQEATLTLQACSIDHVETPHSFGHSPGRCQPSRGPKLSPLFYLVSTTTLRHTATGKNTP